MKTVKIQGGVGNQLFGLAFAHSLAELSDERVALDIAGYDGDRYGHRFLVANLAQSLGFEICRRPWLANRFTSALASRLPAPGYHAETRGRAASKPWRRGKAISTAIGRTPPGSRGRMSFAKPPAVASWPPLANNPARGQRSSFTSAPIGMKSARSAAAYPMRHGSGARSALSTQLPAAPPR